MDANKIQELETRLGNEEHITLTRQEFRDLIGWHNMHEPDMRDFLHEGEAKDARRQD